MEALTKREQDILDFIKKCLKARGYPPTVREICAGVGIKSTATAYKDLGKLESKGYLKKNPSQTRALTIVEEDTTASTTDSGELQPMVEREELVDVPIIGRVAAGTPILAEQNVEDTIPVPARFAGRSNFILRVHGESMINVGIMDGDLILVEEKKEARNGEIIVAMIDGFESEATVKTYYDEGDHIRLQPENDTMSPIIVRNVTVLGKVRGVFRYFS
jgi:repressor LexA